MQEIFGNEENMTDYSNVSVSYGSMSAGWPEEM